MSEINREEIELQIEIFKFSNGIVSLTEHCELIPFLRRIRETFPEDYMKVYSYLYYRTCESPKNPYFNYSVFEREFKILEDLECNFDIENPIIIKAVERLTELYTMPSSFAYTTISETLYKIASEIRNSVAVDLNPTVVKSVLDTAKVFREIKKEFDESRKDVIIESRTAVKTRIRGGSNTAYDD